jgi:hypothetical protein
MTSVRKSNNAVLNLLGDAIVGTEGEGNRKLMTTATLSGDVDVHAFEDSVGAEQNALVDDDKKIVLSPESEIDVNTKLDTGLSGNGLVVTPHDTNDLAHVGYLYVGESGDLVVESANNAQELTFKNVPEGFFAFKVRKVKTATTASDIILIY